GEPVIEISQTHNYRGGIIVFQFFGRSAHLGGALPQIWDARITDSALAKPGRVQLLKIPAATLITWCGAGPVPVTDVRAGRCPLGGSGVTSRPHHRRRPRRPDNSPSSRAAFSRATMATLFRTNVSAISLSQRSRSRSRRPGVRPHSLQGNSFRFRAWQARPG